MRGEVAGGTGKPLVVGLLACDLALINFVA